MNNESIKNEPSQEVPKSPPDLSEFIGRIDLHDEKGKQHLKDIVAMVQEGSIEKRKATHQEALQWYADKEERDRVRNSKLPDELQFKPLVSTTYPDEYYWLESAVTTAVREGYLSEKDEKRTRHLLSQATFG